MGREGGRIGRMGGQRKRGKRKNRWAEEEGKIKNEWAEEEGEKREWAGRG